MITAQGVVISRRDVHERWRVSQDTLLADRSRLQQAIAAVDGVTPSGSVLEWARRVERMAASSATMRDAHRAIERFFRVVRPDEGRAGPRLLQHLEACESSVEQLRQSIRLQIESLRELRSVLDEIGAAGNTLAKAEIEDLTYAAGRTPSGARHLLLLVKNRSKLTSDASALSAAAMERRISTGVSWAGALQETDPEISHRLIDQLADIEQSAKEPVRDESDDHWRRLREAHNRLDAVLGPTRQLSLERTREAIDTACGPSPELAVRSRAKPMQRATGAAIVARTISLLENQLPKMFESEMAPTIPDLGLHATLQQISRGWARLQSKFATDHAANLVNGLVALKETAARGAPVSRARARVCCERIIELSKHWGLPRLGEVEEILATLREL